MPLGVGVPLNLSAPPLPPPPPVEVKSYAEAIKFFDSGLGVAKATSQAASASSSSQPAAVSSTATVAGNSVDELFRAMEAANLREIKAKDEQIGMLKESNKDLESKAAAATSAAAAASSHAAAVEAAARQQTQQVLSEAARIGSELAAGEIRVEELERRSAYQLQVSTHQAARHAELKAEYEKTLQQLEQAKEEVAKLSKPPPPHAPSAHGNRSGCRRL